MQTMIILPAGWDFNLIGGIMMYFTSSLGGTAGVKFLNYHFGFTSWCVIALISRSTWVLSLVMHCVLQRRSSRPLLSGLDATARKLRLYLLVAMGLSIVELLNSFSMTILPGSLYMLLKGSDVGWSMGLSYIILSKRYNRYQVMAATLIMAGIGLVVFLDEKDMSNMAPVTSETRIQKNTGGFSFLPSSMTSSAVLCLLGAFLNALCAVGTEAMLKQTLIDEQAQLLVARDEEADLEETSKVVSSSTTTQPEPRSKLLVSNAYSMWTSLFSFSLLIFPVTFLTDMGRQDHEDDWSSSPPASSTTNQSTTSILEDHSTLQSTAPDLQETTRTTLVLISIGVCLVLLGLSRFVERLAKYFICVHDSAMTFSVVQAARRLSGLYIIGLMFQERFSTAMIVGSICSSIGFALHAWAGRHRLSSSTGVFGHPRPHFYEKVNSSSNLSPDESSTRTSEEMEDPSIKLSSSLFRGGTEEEIEMRERIHHTSNPVP